MNRELHPASDAGFTIIEVMVAMVILLVGVLGTFVLIEGGMASTSATTAREQGTNLARDLVERSRQVDYSLMSVADAPTALRDTLASENPTAVTGSTFTVTRRNVTYAVKVTACSIDDPTDGAGYGAPGEFCEVPETPLPPGSDPPGAAVSATVLGIPIELDGSLLNTVCNALGIEAIAQQLTSLLGPLAPTSICPGDGGVTAPFDSAPDDLRRVRIDVSWPRTSGNGVSKVSQTTLLTNPRLSSSDDAEATI